MGEAEYQSLRTKGRFLAGSLSDLSQRASVYFHMYEDSNKRNVFPLIAAHGALWAYGYFKKGMLGGQILSSHLLVIPTRRRRVLSELHEFADKFREINRRVCTESYAIYFYSKHFGTDDFIESLIGSQFSEILNKCHSKGSAFNVEDRRELFIQFFKWEQENIVAPSVTSAFNQFEWQTIKRLALRPKIEFSYFGANHLKFDDFSSKDERVAKGILAYEKAEEVGLGRVESSLRSYGIMPKSFYDNSAKHFQALESSYN